MTSQPSQTPRTHALTVANAKGGVGKTTIAINLAGAFNDEEIQLLTDAGLLTERQAEAYVRRRIEAEPGYAVAEYMDISQSTLSGYVSNAEEKIEAERDTLDALDAITDQRPE